MSARYIPPNKLVRELMAGAVDLHVHAAPDKATPRRADAYEVAEHAQRLSMGGIVFKNHNESTAGMAAGVQDRFPNMRIFGGVVLNETVGGLSAEVVEACAKDGGKVMWFPTQSAAAHRRWMGVEGGLTVLDESGALTEQTQQILDVLKAHDMVLETGHLEFKECLPLIKRAVEMGMERVVVTHGNTMHYLTGMTTEEMGTLCQQGAFMEFCLHPCMPITFRQEFESLIEMIRAVPEDRAILSTDFGQMNHPIAGEGMWMGIATFLMKGVTAESVRNWVNHNPRRLLGI